MSDSHYYEHVVSAEEAGQRLDSLLGQFEFLVSRSAASRLIEGGNVMVDGVVVAKKHSVRSGERIEIEVPPYDRGDLIAEELRRLDEDEVYARTARTLIRMSPA